MVTNPIEVLAAYMFMQRAFFAVLLVGAISGVVGSYVVVRGMSFFGDALAHAILPGVAVAFVATGSLAGTTLFTGGLAAGVLTALGIGWLTRNRRVKEDTAIGIVFAGMLALGIAIISTARSYSVELTHIMFGNVLGVSDSDLVIMLGCGLFVIGTVMLLYKELLVLNFDPGLATTLKLPTEALRLLLLVLIAVTIVASLQTVGVALMVALLVTPAATAQLLAKRLHHMMALASALAMFSGVFGLFLSYYLGIFYNINISTGAVIVLTSTVIFLLVFALTHIGRK
ncbi:MAG: metal ABC transporter permease [Chloroflexi bacterium]|nr:metal ABC transporter permease [Chloroflexota bacterium]